MITSSFLSYFKKGALTNNVQVLRSHNSLENKKENEASESDDRDEAILPEVHVVLDRTAFQKALKDAANTIFKVKEGPKGWVAFVSGGKVKEKGHYDRFEARLKARGIGITRKPDRQMGVPLFAFAQCWAVFSTECTCRAMAHRSREAIMSNTLDTVIETKIQRVSDALEKHFANLKCNDVWSTNTSSLRPEEYIFTTNQDCHNFILGLRNRPNYRTELWAVIPWKPKSTTRMERHSTSSIMRYLGLCTNAQNYVVQSMEHLSDGKHLEADVLILISSFYPYSAFYHEMNLFDGDDETPLEFGDAFTPEETATVRRRIKLASNHLAVALSRILSPAHHGYVLLSARFSIGEARIPKLLHITCNVHGRNMTDATIDGLLDIITASKRNPMAVGRLAAAVRHSNDTMSAQEPWWELLYTQAVPGSWSFFNLSTCYPDMKVNPVYEYSVEVEADFDAASKYITDAKMISKAVLQTKDNSFNVGPIFKEIDEIAEATNVKHNNRGFAIVGIPHFGGMQQFRKYLIQLRGWSETGLNQNPGIVITVCFGPIANIWASYKPGRLISASPHERWHVVKRPFYRAVKSYFDSINCDYTTFHPETYMIDQNPDHCKLFLESAKRAPPNSKWF